MGLDLKSEKCERIDREETREFIRIIYPTWEECVRRKDMCDKEDKRRTIKRRDGFPGVVSRAESDHY